MSRSLPRLRRSLTATVAAALTAVGLIAVAPSAGAGGPWFVATNGNNNNNCTTITTPCATIAGAIAKAGFVNGDTINVAAGTYVGQTVLTNKGANVVGNGTVVLDGNNQGALPTLAVNGAITVNLTNLTLRNGSSVLYGGGLGVVAGTVNATDVVLRDHKGVNGAAAVVYQGATLTMTGGAILNNTATATGNLFGGGGGVYVVGKTATAPAGSLTLDGVTVSGNVAAGGAFIGSGNGGAVFNSGTTVIRNSTFSGNRVVASTANALRSGQGGAIFNGPQDNDDTPRLTVEDTTITGGLPAGAFNATSGGAIANDEMLSGGPEAAAGVLTLTDTTLRGNTALVGGGLYNGGSVTASGGLLDANTALSGGGVYQSPIVLATANPVATFDGTAFADNTASGLTLANFGNGGAIFNGEQLTVRDATFTGNRAVAATAASAVSGWGGAIYNGAWAAGDTPDLTVTDSVIDGGSVAANAVIGGGIASTSNVLAVASGASAELALTRTTVTSNVAAAGGGVYTGGPTTVTGGSLDHNAATHASAGYGGAVYATPSPVSQPGFDLTLDGVDVSANSAAVVGGGLAVLHKVTADIDGSAVTDNSSSISAGGVYNAGDTTVTDSEVSGNDAAFQAGGIYNGSTVATDTPTLELTDVRVDDNTAASTGGGIVTLKNASLDATGGHLDGNSAVGGGGLVVGDGAAASFDGTDFTGNVASASGGGAALNLGTLTLAHATLAGNKALQTTGNTGLGGAIYSGSNTANAVTSLELEASTLTGNEAYAASALITFSPGSGATNTASIERSTITGNSSTSAVGAIEQFHPLTITASTITDNTSAGGNGALAMFLPGSVTVAATILTGNTGPECSGAVADGGYNLTDTSGAGCGFASNAVVGDPQLGALSDNGGPTETRKPGPASPALDRIPAGALCGAGSVDQREVTRPQGARCDIGAVEVVQVAPTVDGPAGADLTVGSAAAPLTFTTTGTPQATLSASSLPAGVTFTDNHDGTGTLAGTPAANTGGDHTITITATNEAGSGTHDIVLTIHQAPILSGPGAATYRVGQPGGPDEFTQTSGHPEATLSTDSVLPGGVIFTPEAGGKGHLAGTPVAGSGGVYPITIKGSNGTPPDATWPFVLTVEESTGLTGPATATFTVGAPGSSAELTGSGYPTPTLSASGLPAGLHLDGTGPGRARITGQPANGTGGVYDVTVTATNGIGPDATHHVSVTVNEAPEITGPAAVRFVATFAGQTVFSADGYPGAALTVTGTLPDGVGFVDNGNGTATLSGTPTEASVGTYQLTVRASNGVDPDATHAVTLEIAPPLGIDTSVLPAAAIGTPYGASIAASGGLAPYEFSLASGSLPAGLSLAADGSVTGTPTGPTGTSTFVVRVTDSADPEQTATRQVSLTVGKGESMLDVDPVLIRIVPAPLGLSIKIGVVGATLTGGSPAHPIAGQTIVFKAGNVTVCTGVTNANGRAECTMNVVNTLLVIGHLRVKASYDGNASWNPSSGNGNLIGN